MKSNSVFIVRIGDRKFWAQVCILCGLHTQDAEVGLGPSSRQQCLTSTSRHKWEGSSIDGELLYIDNSESPVWQKQILRVREQVLYVLLIEER